MLPRFTRPMISMVRGAMVKSTPSSSLFSARYFSVLKFTKDHEFVQFEQGEDHGAFGISEFAASELGDVVYVELPEGGSSFSAGEVAASVESVKAASSVYAPIDCTVTESNEALNDDPSAINNDAYEGGWMYKAKFDNATQLDDLMSKEEYDAYLETLQSEKD